MPGLMLAWLVTFVACGTENGASTATNTPPSADQTAPERPAASSGSTPSAVPPNASEVFEARRKAVNVEVMALIADLEAAGRYDCCTAHPCKHCSLIAGGCRCGEGLRDGDPVCEECARMWEQGQGAEAVPADSVRSFTEAARLQTGKICGEPRLLRGSRAAPPQPSAPPKMDPVAPIE